MLKQEEKFLQKSGTVVRTYGLMAIFAAISLSFIGLTPSTILALLAVIISCVLITYFATHKRVLVEA